MSEAPGYGQSVMTYDPGSRGALTYFEAAREMAERGTRMEPVIAGAGGTGAGESRTVPASPQEPVSSQEAE